MSINSFNSLLDKAISVANVAGKKTEEMVEASKLKIQEVSVNADLANCYEKIGSLVYSSKKFGADNEQEIAQLRRALDRFNRELHDVRVRCDATTELSAFWRVTDIVWDNLFSDWTALSQISEAKEQVERTDARILDILRQLQSVREDMRRAKG